MDFSFVKALALLGKDAAFRFVNGARPPSDYLFNTILPERLEPSYSVDEGDLVVRTTMAGITAMDSPYPPGGVVTLSEFGEKTLKVANDVGLPETALRKLQELMRRRDGGTTSTEALAQEALNFLDKVILQAHFDTMEYLRAQALTFGTIDFTYNRKHIQVDYLFPTGHLFNTRTTASTEAYGATGSLFWTDMRDARRVLKGPPEAIIMHPDTADAIIYNPANRLEMVNQGPGFYVVRRLTGANDRPSQDVRDTIRFVVYDREAELLDPASEDTTNVPFMAPGKIILTGGAPETGYRVGEGSTEDPDNDLELGYTHIGPTVEAGGALGRWARLYVPPNEDYRLHGKGVTNGLPVIRNANRIVVLSTELPA